MQPCNLKRFAVRMHAYVDVQVYKCIVLRTNLSFLAFFGHFLEANLGPQRVIFSLFWTLGVGSPLSGLGWSGLGAGLGVPFSGRLGTPNPGTRLLHLLLTLLYFT